MSELDAYETPPGYGDTIGKCLTFAEIEALLAAERERCAAVADRRAKEAQGRIATLEEALRPFADCCDNAIHDPTILQAFRGSASVLHLVRNGNLTPTGVAVSDLLKARDLLYPETDGDRS